MFKDRAIETIDAAFTGTGTYNLGGAATNSQALDSAFGSGATFFYLVRNADWSKFEIGYGVVTSGSPDTLTRNVKRSYNGSAFGTSAVSWVLGDHPLYVYSAPVGEELAQMRRTHRGTSAPTPAEAGLLWEDSTGAPTGVLLKIYDGTDWITIGTVDETANTFAPAIGDGTITAVKLATDAVETAKIKDLNVTTGKLAANAVSNAKLAQVATATIKGRTTAGTGDPEDLTATQATALLNAVVGDSGSGGTKGLVPAPGAGDAAAEKYLKASGAWAALTVPIKHGGTVDTGTPAASQQVNGLAALNARHLIFFGKATPSTDGVTMSIKLLKSDGTSLAVVTTGTGGNSGSSPGWNFWGVATQVLDATYKSVYVGWYGNGGNGAAWGQGTNTSIVDQVQMAASSGNISGNLQVYYVT